ncbi:MAG: hypothetical protein JW793_10320 [Acidobacteria bacterium]|nr:hypothetical protein [Acidobacteriota bacterium]
MAEFKPEYIITEMKKDVVLAWGMPGTPLEEYIISKSFAAIIPKGVSHGPLTLRNVRKPIFHYTVGDAGLYA